MISLYQVLGYIVRVTSRPIHRLYIVCTHNVETMLCQRLRRWPNIVSTLGQCIMFFVWRTHTPLSFENTSGSLCVDPVLGQLHKR